MEVTSGESNARVSIDLDLNNHEPQVGLFSYLSNGIRASKRCSGVP